LKKNDFLTKS